ncbi:competence type IV pilus minor pilin ComGF [Lacticigenium naphthae]|uniref:competence type IV pilus minor pilin ComGF n=1 Tax=Lacticigenium naphthae TaxID=515351 RepID=UPI00040D0A14|nr:competence type IV pilus minor pilin ComGF [Lacticigenium naphthae]
MKKKSKFYTVLSNDEKGFSYLEILLSLFILLSTVHLLSLGMKQVEVIENNLFQTSQNEWHIFLNQVENIIESPISVECQSSKIVFIYPDKKFVLEYYRNGGQQMIRKVENGGHEPYLMNVKECRFYQENSNMFLRVKLADQNSYTALLYSYTMQEMIDE